jgi:hypothetical protein
MHADHISWRGESVTFQRDTETDQTVSVIWSDGEAAMAPGVRAVAWAPETSFVWILQKGDTCIRETELFRVIDPPGGGIGPERDGGGGLNIYLKRVYGTNP